MPRHRPAKRQPSVIAAEYRELAEAIAAQFPEGQPAVLMFANPSEAERRTDLHALADALAEQTAGESLAVDCRFRPLPSADLVEEWRQEYRFVLVEAGPLDQTQGVALAKFCDGVYLTVQLGQTGRRAARKAIARLQKCGGKVLGTILLGSS